MLMTPLAVALWVADSLGTVGLLVLLFRLRLARQWPSLVTLLSSDLLFWIPLALIHKHYRWYFYTYWVWTAIDAGLRLWVLADCLRSIPGTGFIPTNARLMLLTITFGIAGACGIWAFYSDHSWVQGWRDALFLYNRAANFAALVFATVTLGLVAVLGLGWARLGARIATGLGFDLALAAIRSEAFTHSSQKVRIAADYLTNLSHLAVLAVWLIAVLGSRRGFSIRRGSSPTPPTIQRRVLQTT